MARHLPALEHVAAVAEHLGDERVERKPADEHDALLAECREHPVFLLEHEPRRDGRGLLPVGSTVEADASLALQDDHARVEQAQPTHLAVAAQEHVVAEERVVRRVGSTVVTQDAQQAQILFVHQ